MIKRIVIALGLIGLLAAVVAGCGSGGSSSHTTAAVPVTPVEPPTQQPPEKRQGNSTTKNPSAKQGDTAGSCIDDSCAIVHKKPSWKVSNPPSNSSSPLPQPQTISKSLDSTCQMILFTSPPQMSPPSIGELSGQFGPTTPGQGYKQIKKGYYLLPIAKVKSIGPPRVTTNPLKQLRPGKGRVVSISQVGIRYLTHDGKKYAIPLSLTTTPKKTKPCSASAISTAQAEITEDLIYYMKSAGV